MKEIFRGVWLVVGLVIGVNAAANGYVAGLLRKDGRNSLLRQEINRDGMCITLNQPCTLEESELIATHSSINNQVQAGSHETGKYIFL